MTHSDERAHTYNGEAGLGGKPKWMELVGEAIITRETKISVELYDTRWNGPVGSFKGFYRQGQPIVRNYEFPDPNWAELRAGL